MDIYIICGHAVATDVALWAGTYVCWRMLTYALHYYIRRTRSGDRRSSVGGHVLGWRMLTYADVCWRMLTYAYVCRTRSGDGGSSVGGHVPGKETLRPSHQLHFRHLLHRLCICCRMLTYADVCWHMLTHADICWHMQARSSSSLRPQLPSGFSNLQISASLPCTLRVPPQYAYRRPAWNTRISN